MFTVDKIHVFFVTNAEYVCYGVKKNKPNLRKEDSAIWIHI